jgi:DNA ligase-4
VKKLGPEQMKWFVRIIMKDLKLIMSEKALLKVFHPDAEESMNANADLKKVLTTICF